MGRLACRLPMDALVLCYHAIGESWPSSVSENQLREHVRLLLRRGYRGTTFTETVAANGTGRTFAVTFDDAHGSVVDRALPVLRDLGVPGTVFVVTSFANDGRALEWPGLLESGVSGDPAARASLTWDDLRGLVESGWEVGSHTATHRHLTAIDDAALERELRGSRDDCAEALGRPCRALAYPYGDVDERVVRAAAAAGYAGACSLSVATSGQFCWPRIGVYAVDTPMRFRLKVSPTVLRLRRALASRGR